MGVLGRVRCMGADPKPGLDTLGPSDPWAQWRWPCATLFRKFDSYTAAVDTFLRIAHGASVAPVKSAF